MTREEAIAILQEEIDGNLELTLSEWRERDEQKLFPAIRMAIEALSAEAVQGAGRYENAMQKLREMPRYLNGVKEKQITKISADAVPQLRQTDTLIIADALRYLAQDTERHELDRTRAEELREQILRYGASMCSSADAVHGEWKAHRVSLDFICSNCGEACWSDFDYCPHCGARMEKIK